jgi:hypothetical protein
MRGSVTTICCLLLVAVSATARPDPGRFFRIVRLYGDPVYRMGDHDIALSGAYQSRSEESGPDSGSGFSEYYDVETEFNRTIDNDLALKGITLKSDQLRSGSFAYSAGIKGRYSDVSKLLRNDMIGKSDIYENVSVQENLYADLDKEHNRYFQFLKSWKWFAGFDAVGKLEAGGVYDRMFSEERLTDIDSEYRKRKQIRGWGNLDFMPQAGWGKPVPVTPVYQAFEIERSLSESGVIRGPLSDRTMVRIARWLATEYPLRRTRDRHTKYFFAALDTIVKKDSAMVNCSTNGYAIMDVRDKTWNSVPLLWNGLKVVFGAVGSLRAGYENTRYSTLDTSSGWDGRGFEFEQQSRYFSFSLLWGQALSPHLHYLIEASAPPSFSSEKSPDGLRAFLPDSAPHAHLDMSVYYLVTDRLHLSATMTSLPLRYIVPYTQPASLEISARYFIEDRITLKTSFTHKYYEDRLEREWGDRYVYTMTQTNANYLKLELFYDL